MFEDLDDPEGVPHGEGRLAETMARARRMRAQRRTFMGAGTAALVLAVVAVVASVGDPPQRPVNVAAQPDGSSAELTDTTDTTSVVEETTTTEAPATTTTRVPAKTATTTHAPTTTSTTPAARYELEARLYPSESTAAGTAGADNVGSDSWRIVSSLTGLAPNLAHVVYVQENNNGIQPIQHLCEFTSSGEAAGGCTGTISFATGPAYLTVMAYDSGSNGYRTVAGGPFMRR